MAQVDPWEKAADCERAIRIILDPVHRETLSNVREFWIALAENSRFLSDNVLANQIENDWPSPRQLLPRRAALKAWGMRLARRNGR
jgi:hypothetical protein